MERKKKKRKEKKSISRLILSLSHEEDLNKLTTHKKGLFSPDTIKEAWSKSKDLDIGVPTDINISEDVCLVKVT